MPAAALDRALTEMAGTAQFVQLVKQFQLQDRYADLLALAQQHPNEQIGIEAIVALLDLKQWNLITKSMYDGDLQLATATAEVLGTAADGRIGGPLLAVIKDAEADLEVRRAAVRAASRGQQRCPRTGSDVRSGPARPGIEGGAGCCTA
jgi:HEAT repeat protein